MSAHVDVAAYALGALSDRESSQFEDHLVGCATCAAELESMVQVVTMMSDVSLGDVTGEAPPVVGPYTAATGIPTIGGLPPAAPPLPPPATPPPPAFTGPMTVPGAPQVPPMTPPPAAPVTDPRREEPMARRDDRREELLEERRGDRRGDLRAPASLPAPTPIERGRPKRRRGGVVLLAAAAAVVGAVGGGALVAETGYFDPPAQPSVTAADDEPVAPIPGEKVSATDKQTGAHVEASLDGKVWGTKVSFLVTKIEGPKTCRLVAVRRNGDTEVLSTWTVPDGGYGYEVRPQPLALTAATSIRSKDITRLEVQAMADGGDPSTLVSVRV
jgi:hypothetical protein